MEELNEGLDLQEAIRNLREAEDCENCNEAVEEVKFIGDRDIWGEDPAQSVIDTYNENNDEKLSLDDVKEIISFDLDNAYILLKDNTAIAMSSDRFLGYVCDKISAQEYNDIKNDRLANPEEYGDIKADQKVEEAKADRVVDDYDNIEDYLEYVTEAAQHIEEIKKMDLKDVDADLAEFGFDGIEPEDVVERLIKRALDDRKAELSKNEAVEEKNCEIVYSQDDGLEEDSIFTGNAKEAKEVFDTIAKGDFSKTSFDDFEEGAEPKFTKENDNTIRCDFKDVEYNDGKPTTCYFYLMAEED